VYLGESNALSFDLMRDNDGLWLGMRIGDDAELEPRLLMATAPYSAYSAYSEFSQTCGPHEHAWSEITNVPADLADGDANTTYTASVGLTLNGTAFSVNTNTIQRRVLAQCGPGSSIRTIDAFGNVGCQVDQVGGNGTITQVTAGVGLNGGGSSGAVTLSADLSTLQRRVIGSCAVGSSIQSIDANGTVTCEQDDDQDSLAGATVSVEFIATRANTAGTTSTPLISANNSFCFLTRTHVHSVGANNEGAGCQIVNTGGQWRLDAILDTTDDQDVMCTARCLSW
jgi:hypothetical protein